LSETEQAERGGRQGPVDWQGSLAWRARALKPSAIRAVSRYAQEPGVISFASGSPNPAFFPQDAIQQAMARIMSNQVLREQALQYGASEGYAPLRRLIAERLGRGADEILITNGSQQGLSFLGMLLIDPGNRIIVTEPTYLGALQAFSLSEPRYVGVPAEGDGLDMGALERAFAGGAKFMYVMPDFGNPSGMTLPLPQRRRILVLAREHGIPVVEDQAYDQLRLSGESLPTLLSLDPEVVIHAGTFSKSLAPGLRVGWLAARPEVIDKLVSIKQATDLHVGVLNQVLVHEVVTTLPAGHGDALRAGYRMQRDAMMDSLARHMPPGTHWNHPEGGMFIWLTLPGKLDAQMLLEDTVRKEKVLFVPGAPFFTGGSGANMIRLSFSLVMPDVIDAGIERLGRAIRRHLSGEHR
jgi:DNA-binding transcriptional MocR family regulator